MPTTLSVIAFLAWLVACVGSPWVSYLISLTWVTPDLALCCSSASSAPLEMLMPSWAFGPVWAPMKPIVAEPPPDEPPPPELATVVVAAAGGKNEGRGSRCGHQTPGVRTPHELPPWKPGMTRRQPARQAG